MKSEPFFALAAAALLLVSGCGQTGALYLPGDVPAAEADAAANPDADDSDEDERPDNPDNTP